MAWRRIRMVAEVLVYIGRWIFNGTVPSTRPGLSSPIGIIPRTVVRAATSIVALTCSRVI